ncbi:iron ABC transporter permease [Nocardioides sp. REDSEA-S30_B4]|uniref:ABC transporter permease n=1 Tax=Nocardioides sp. REDSEA-S30_B4 TaxID=1811552 RepID=UPI000A88FD2F|nr:ABC transporter permease subunit [Nocardioides sp. REDSEA-S30_B4]
MTSYGGSGARRLAGLAALAVVPTAVLGVFFVLPVTGMVSRGFVTDGALDLGGVLEVLGRPRTRRVLWFTVWSSAVATTIAVLLGLPAAYATHRLRWPGRRVVRACLLVPFVLPTVVVGVAFRQLLGEAGPLGFLGLDGTARAIIAGLVFFNVAVVVRGVGAAWESLDARPGEAAAALGASPAQVFRTVTWPLRAVPDATVTRRAPTPRRPRRADTVPLVLTVLVLAFVALPVLALVTGSLRPDDSWSLEAYRALSGRGSAPGQGGTALLVPVTEALVTSLRTAVDATWMALLLGGLLALLLTRRSRSRTERRVRSVLDGLFMLPLGVSAVTLGFGFLITLDEPPLDLRDSPLLIPLAQALVALPLVVRTLVPVLSGVDDRLRQAAASLGAGPVRALVTVDLPVVWKPLLAAGGFAFAVSLGEFGATSFLARPDDPTLPVVIFRLIGRPGPLNDEMAMAASVVLAGTTALVMLLVERLRVPSVGAL